MAIGGYKFRGYHYPARTATAGSDEEKAIFLDWFKCRLAAFKASCEASGALWRLLPACADSGTYSGTAWSDEDACIHVLDNTGCNFGTFFQYGNEDKYMAMCVQNTGGYSLLSRRWCYSSSSSSMTDYSNDVIALDTAPITPENIPATPTGRLPFSGAQARLSTNSPDITRNVSSYTNGLIFGFATKNADIIEFYSAASLCDNIGAAYISFLVTSPDGFSSLCSPTDIYPAVAYSHSLSYLYQTSVSNTTALNDLPFGFLRNTGTLYTGDSFSGGINKLGIFSEKMGAYWPTSSTMPFASPLVRNAIVGAESSTRINDDGIASKGCIRVDLLATNTDLSQQQQNSTVSGSVYGGGNYLCAGGVYATSASSYPNQGAIYLGWDPSNPSILASTSWPDWPDAM
jgi:hypothetical protein